MTDAEMQQIAKEFCESTWREADRKEAGPAKSKPKQKKRKHHNQYTKHKQLRIDDSLQTVNRVERHGLGLWKNKRIVVGFRGDEKLYKAFKPAAIEFFGSTCNAFESFMASVVAVAKTARINAVNRQPTVSIGEIKIERNLRERRKITKTVEVETETTETLSCGFATCNNEATEKGFYNDKEVPLCANHFRKLINSHSIEWRFY
jgi:hypothetical protein